MKVVFRNIATLKTARFDIRDLTVLVSDGSSLPSMAFSLLHGLFHHLWLVPLTDSLDSHARQLIETGEVTLDVSGIVKKPKGHFNRVGGMLEKNPAYLMGRDYSVISRSLLGKLRVEISMEAGDLPVLTRQEGFAAQGYQTVFDPDRGILTVRQHSLADSAIERPLLNEIVAMSLDMDLKKLIYGDLIRSTRSLAALRAGRAALGSYVLAASEMASLPAPSGDAHTEFESIQGFVTRHTEGLTPLQQESLNAPLLRKGNSEEAVTMVENAAGGRFEPGTEEGRQLLESGELKTLAELAPIMDFVPNRRAAHRVPLALAGPREQALFELWAFASFSSAKNTLLFWEMPEMNLHGENEFLAALTSVFIRSGIKVVVHTRDLHLADAMIRALSSEHSPALHQADESSVHPI